jgi:hypothetical protein
MPRGRNNYEQAKQGGRLWTPKEWAGTPDGEGWYDFGDVSSLQYSTGISRVKDKFGKGRDLTQSTGGSQPTLVGGGAYFSPGGGGTAILNTGGLLPTTYDFLIVGTPESTSAYRTALINSNNNHPLLLPIATTAFGAWDGSFKQAGSYTWSGLGLVYGSVQSGTNISMSKNGAGLSACTGVNITQTQVLGVGNFTGAGTQGFGTIYELIFMPPNMPASKRDKVEGYAVWKAAMERRGFSLLDAFSAKHPFKNRPPLIGD